MDTKYNECGPVESHSPVLKQTEEINKKLKELMQAKNAKEVEPIETTELLVSLSVNSLISNQDSASCSWYSAGSVGTYDSKTGGIQRKSDDQAVSCLPTQVRGSDYVPNFAGPSCYCFETESKGNIIHPVGVYDTFEIADIRKGVNQPYKQMLEELTHEINSMSGMPSPTPEESLNYLFRGDVWLNKACMIGHFGNKSSPPRRSSFLQHGNKLSTPSKGTSLGIIGFLVILGLKLVLLRWILNS